MLDTKLMSRRASAGKPLRSTASAMPQRRSSSMDAVSTDSAVG